MKRFLILFILLIIMVSPIFSEVEFQLPVFGQDNNLVFTAKTDVPGMASNTSLFSVELEDPENGTKKEIKQLSVFPEEAVMLGGNGVLQIRNRFGIFRSDKSFTKLEILKSFPSFENGEHIQNGKLKPLTSSPDGGFLTYLKPVSYAYGELILYNVDTGEETLISENVEIDYSKEVTLWSPDSKFFIYTKGGNVFYYSIEKFYRQKSLSDDFRKIGKGSIRSVRWTSDNILYYFKDNIIYKIISAELFTGSLYLNLLQSGEPAGKIPFKFNPLMDSFFVSPRGDKIIYNKAEDNIFVFPLRRELNASPTGAESLPYLHLPENTKYKKLFWSVNDVITILASSISNGKEENTIFRLDMKSAGKDGNFTRLSESNVIDIAISSNSRSIAIIYPDNIEIKDYQLWTNIKKYSFNSPLTSFWIDESNLLVLGRYSIEKINLQTNLYNVLAISQAESGGYTKDGSIFAKNNDNYFLLGSDGLWRHVSSVDVGSLQPVSTDFRSTLQPLSNNPYKNIIILKHLDSVVTEPLFSYPNVKYETLKIDDEKIDLENFSHGSRNKGRELAIVFNVVDSETGISDVLKVLSDFGIRSTFFLNGDFINQNPESTKELGNSKHEIGSLFFTYFNMTDSQYRMDKDFIKKGLAKNEDDYFAVTGKELSLLWHAPYYSVNSDIINVSSEMNYHYINRDVYTLEWMKKTSSYKKVENSYDMIEKIMETKKPGSIIPIMIGESEERASLCTMLDLLVNNLINEGYNIVPVSVLLNKAGNQD